MSENEQPKFYKIWHDERAFFANYLRDEMKETDAPSEEIEKFNKDFCHAEPPEEKKITRGHDKGGRLKTVGLALSGGGIRAASFSLGVMQGLNIKKNGGQKRLLEHVDYLSTVSGGGYIGAAFTRYRNIANDPRKKKKLEGVDASTFPEPEYDLLGRKESRMVDFSRFRRNHLTPTGSLNFVSLIAITLRTILISWPIYLFALSLIMALYFIGGEIIGHAAYKLIAFLPEDMGDTLTDYKDKLFLIITDPEQVLFGALLVTVFVLWFLGLLIYALIAACSALYDKQHYVRRRTSQTLQGQVITCLLISLVLTVTPLFAGWVQEIGGIPALVSVIVSGNAVGSFGLISFKGGSVVNRVLTTKAIVFLAALALLVSNVILAYEIGEFLVVQLGLFLGVSNEGDPRLLAFISLIIIIALFLFLGAKTNINYVSLHRMYRDRLMEAFMPDISAFLEKDNKRPAKEADQLLLKDCLHRPLHLVNTNVVLSNSENSRYKGRAGDSFILAPHYCGSWATRFRLTRDFSAKPASASSGTASGKEKVDSGMTLATAMAISGAAVNPRVGPSGWATPLSNPVAASMASFLNLRLGCWVANPASKDQAKQANFFNAGKDGLLNRRFKESEPLVELTDGGHFENTGIYELLRRRTDVIIFSDASADQTFNFKDIGIAIERARVDLSVDIRFTDEDYDLTYLMPGSAGDKHYDKRYDLAKRGFAIATIKYPAFRYEDPNNKGVVIDVPEKKGHLIYLKTVLTREMPADIYSYKGAFKAFPYQPISDQMFDESQFESYRELGYRVTEAMNKELYDNLMRVLETNHDTVLVYP